MTDELCRADTASISEIAKRGGLTAIISYMYGALHHDYANFFEHYHPYAGPRGYLAVLDQLLHRHPLLLTSMTGGQSTSGWPLPAVRLSLGANTKKQRIMITGLLHGCEFIGAEVCLGVLQRLISEYEEGFTERLSTHEFYFLPVLNPDAFVDNIERVCSGRRFGGLRRQNARGVDLNRNFDDAFAKHPWTARLRAWRTHEYAGTHAFSEAETCFVRDFVGQYSPTAAISLHSFYGAILYPPWSDRRTDLGMQALAQTMARAMEDPYVVVQGSHFIDHVTKGFAPLVRLFRHATVEGTLDGWLYAQGIPSLLVEIWRPSFALAALSRLYAFNPPPALLDAHINTIYPAVTALCDALTENRRGPSMTPASL